MYYIFSFNTVVFIFYTPFPSLSKDTLISIPQSNIIWRYCYTTKGFRSTIGYSFLNTIYVFSISFSLISYGDFVKNLLFPSVLSFFFLLTMFCQSLVNSVTVITQKWIVLNEIYIYLILQVSLLYLIDLPIYFVLDWDTTVILWMK